MSYFYPILFQIILWHVSITETKNKEWELGGGEGASIGKSSIFYYQGFSTCDFPGVLVESFHNFKPLTVMGECVKLVNPKFFKKKTKQD